MHLQRAALLGHVRQMEELAEELAEEALASALLEKPCSVGAVFFTTD